MKATRIAVAFVLTLSASLALAASDAQNTFNKLKMLEGTWEGKTAQGQPVKVTYHVISGGTAIMSEASEDAMVTMYHLDGDRLLMTHYCGAGNQPRMVGKLSADGKSLDFSFIDATNLASAKSGHMQHATFNFADGDHYSEQWTFSQDGKETTEQFSLERRQ